MSHTVSVAKSAPETLILAPQDPAGIQLQVGGKILPALVAEFELCCDFPRASPSRPTQGGSNGYLGSWLPKQPNNKKRMKKWQQGTNQGFPGVALGRDSLCWPRLAGISSVAPRQEARKESVWVTPDGGERCVTGAESHCL